MKFQITALLLLLLFTVSPLSFAANYMPATEKVAIEKHLEDRLSAFLDSVIADKEFSVVVNVTLNPGKEINRERWVTKTKKSKIKSPFSIPVPPQSEELMPGIPSKSEFVPINESQPESETSKTAENYLSIPNDIISSMKAMIVLDRKTTPEQIEAIKNISSVILGINKKRGDVLTIRLEDLSFLRPASVASRSAPFLTIGFLAKYFLTLLAAAALLLLFVNRIGSIAAFAVDSLKEGRKRDMPQMMGMMMQQGQTSAGPEMIETYSKRGGGGIKRPFSFLTEADIPKLSALLKTEDFQTIANVLSAIDPRFSAQLLSQLSPRVQEEMFPYLVSMRHLDVEQIRALEQGIRNKLEGTLGGVDSFVKTMNYMDNASSERVLSTLARVKPELKKEIHSQVILFSDLIGLASADLAKVLMTARLEETAMVIQASDDEIKNKMIASLPEETMELVNEWLDIMPKQTPERIDAAKKNLCNSAKQLEKSGSITIERGAVAGAK